MVGLLDAVPTFAADLVIFHVQRERLQGRLV